MVMAIGYNYGTQIITSQNEISLFTFSFYCLYFNKKQNGLEWLPSYFRSNTPDFRFFALAKFESSCMHDLHIGVAFQKDHFTRAR